MKKQITVFTPSYNRADTLKFLYDSLLRQSVKEFCWLIVDDGSTDQSKALVEKFIEEKLIDIKYVYQQNYGMVAAHNKAYQFIDTELSICIDSDDFLTDNALELILKEWNSLDNKNILGFVGLDVYKSGKVIGDKFPDDVKFMTFSEMIHKYKIKGDKKFVLNVEVIKNALPYPFIKGEKYPAPSYLYLMLEDKFKFKLINEPLCVVEYLPTGNSMNKKKMYFQSPNAFAEYRKLRIKKSYNFKDKVKNIIHYISSKLIARKSDIISDSPSKFLTILLFPAGIFLYFYLRSIKRNSISKNLNK